MNKSKNQANCRRPVPLIPNTGNRSSYLTTFEQFLSSQSPAQKFDTTNKQASNENTQSEDSIQNIPPPQSTPKNTNQFEKNMSEYNGNKALQETSNPAQSVPAVVRTSNVLVVNNSVQQQAVPVLSQPTVDSQACSQFVLLNDGLNPPRLIPILSSASGNPSPSQFVLINGNTNQLVSAPVTDFIMPGTTNNVPIQVSGTTNQIQTQVTPRQILPNNPETPSKKSILRTPKQTDGNIMLDNTLRDSSNRTMPQNSSFNRNKRRSSSPPYTPIKKTVSWGFDGEAERQIVDTDVLRHTSIQNNPLKNTSTNNDRLARSQSQFTEFDDASMLEDESMTAYECHVCSFETIYEDIFNEHMLTHKKSKKETFHKCPKCPFKLRCRAGVRKHMVAGVSKTEYCGLYSYSDECKVDLDLHLEMYKQDERRHGCIGQS